MAHKKIGAFFVSVFVFSLVGVVVAQELPERSRTERKIVVFKDGLSDADEARAIANARGTRVKKLRHGSISVVQLDAAAANRLAQQKSVLRVEDDVVVEALQERTARSSRAGGGQAPSEVLPWGIDRIDAELVQAGGESGEGINVGVIDTGIQTNHPDLAVAGGVSEVSYTNSYNDDNGHGTHVAGTVGALVNGAGVIGAAPKVNVYAIKVLDRRGSGYLSDVIDGIDWAVANGMHVVNMSLGVDVDIQSFRDAVGRAYAAGVVVVAAAGNSGGSVSYPAAYPETIAVAATDISNTAPYWSSRGPEVDLAAPGVSIYSTYRGSKYATMSGTSMAAPHVAGTVALVLKKTPDTAFDGAGNCTATYDANCDGVWDPAEVAAKLKATAIDLGVGGPDEVYGFGLVNARAAFAN